MSWPSYDRRTNFYWQEDGNLVVYVDGTARWNSVTYDRGGFVCWQNDGNLVVYDTHGGALWHSNTYGYFNAELVVQDDGNVVIYEDRFRRRAVWHTNSYRR